MSTIRFEAKLFKIGSWTLIRLPKSASEKLPSRGQTFVEGTIKGIHFQDVSRNGVLLEPTQTVEKMTLQRAE